MSSNGRSPLPAPDLTLPATAEDVAALRRARAPRALGDEEYLRLLAACRATQEQLRARRGPRGEPFRL